MSWFGKIIGGAIGAVGGPVGIAAGAAAGHYLFDNNSEIDEETETLIEIVSSYCEICYSAAYADHTLTTKEKAHLEKILKDLIVEVELDDFIDKDEFLEELLDGNAVSAMESAQYVASLENDDLKNAIKLDILKIIFSNGNIDGNNYQWLDTFIDHSNIENWDELSIYTRDENDQEIAKDSFYKELGISKSATKDEIKKAYRKAATLYHPDKINSLPEHIRELTEEKFKLISHAYNMLMKDSSFGLEFLKNVDEVIWFEPSDYPVVTKCILCGQANRIVLAEKALNARCGECHSLLGINE